MRLVHSKTLQIHEFTDHEIPEYAILSHRWEKEEVTFHDMETGVGPSKAGYWKIRQCGEQAAKDGLEYFWIDTCCIDKRSSSELSEAVNSMYRWYQRSKICYAYLSDVFYFQGYFANSQW